jgi:hypothetical protein
MQLKKADEDSKGKAAPEGNKALVAKCEKGRRSLPTRLSYCHRAGGHGWNRSIVVEPVKRAAPALKPGLSNSSTSTTAAHWLASGKPITVNGRYYETEHPSNTFLSDNANLKLSNACLNGADSFHLRSGGATEFSLLRLTVALRGSTSEQHMPPGGCKGVTTRRTRSTNPEHLQLSPSVLSLPYNSSAH